MKLSEYKSPALVLSGGGIKAAAFHIGVCLALKQLGFNFAGGSKSFVENNFDPDDSSLTFKTYVGSSAGSVVCSFLAAGFSIESIIEAFTQGNGIEGFKQSEEHRNGSSLKPLSYKDIFSVNLNASPVKILANLFRKTVNIKGGFEVMLKKSLKYNGFFSTDNLEKYLRENVFPNSNNFNELGIKLFIIATQLNHSRKAIFGPFAESSKTKTEKYANFATISQAVAASTSLPPVFAPYGIVNQKGKEIQFFDGEIRDTLSTHVASDNGSDLVIASYSIQPYHYNDEMGSLHEYGIPVILNQALYQVVQQKIESHIQQKKSIKEIIGSIEGYLKEIKLPEKHRTKLIDIILKKTDFKKDVEYIYIHPSPQDYEMFFADHFSLNPEILDAIVRTGFRSAMTTLRFYKI